MSSDFFKIQLLLYLENQGRIFFNPKNHFQPICFTKKHLENTLGTIQKLEGSLSSD